MTTEKTTEKTTEESISNERFCYVGVDGKGQTVAAVVDNPDHPDDVRNTVNDMMKDGLKIERVPASEARRRLMDPSEG